MNTSWSETELQYQHPLFCCMTNLTNWIIGLYVNIKDTCWLVKILIIFIWDNLLHSWIHFFVLVYFTMFGLLYTQVFRNIFDLFAMSQLICWGQWLNNESEFVWNISFFLLSMVNFILMYIENKVFRKNQLFKTFH